MNYLKEIAWKENCDIQGRIVQRDWGHVDRLTHFYQKHSFYITLNKEEKKRQNSMVR